MWISIQFHLQNYRFSSNPTIKGIKNLLIYEIKKENERTSDVVLYPKSSLDTIILPNRLIAEIIFHKSV